MKQTRMIIHKKYKIVIVVLLVITVCVVLFSDFFHPSGKIDFNTQIRPILNKNCIACHGGVKQSGGFSVLFREEAIGKTKSGSPAIIPGDPNHSEFIARLTSRDPAERMPLEKDPLPAADIALLKEWIRQGAVWDEHWAFKKPKEQTPPEVTDTAILRNGIDHFIVKGLAEEKLTLAGEADKQTLLRRVSMDIIGCLPDTQAANTFLRDGSAKAYENLVNTLLASPHYGEKWASMWLDLARYADSKGYEKDKHRDTWPYRDWLIRSLNSDMPYDRFITEQIAGDLLPHPTSSQLIATTFHRNTMSNDEGGTDDEEFRIASLIDRVNTTFEVFQGITMGCVQCHSHPYEPIRHKEYYRFLSYFNNSADADLPSDFPLYRDMFTPDNEIKVMRLIDTIQRLTNDSTTAKSPAILRREILLPQLEAEDCDDYNYGILSDNAVVWDENGVYKDGLTFMMFTNIDLTGVDRILFNVKSERGHSKIDCRLDSVNGTSAGQTAIAPTGKKFSVKSFPIRKTLGFHDLYFVLSDDLNKEPGPGDFDWFRLAGKKSVIESARVLKLKKELAAIPRIKLPVMHELNPSQRRTTHVFTRGNYQVPGDQVDPGIPSVYHYAAGGLPKNRLAVAHWLTDPDNPLTARVEVNRLWEQLFGTGIVETPEDFGSQGAKPSNPGLLDWLALELSRNFKWSVKRMIREIVLSATYRQRSDVTPEKWQKDPRNIYLSHFPKTRWSAEQLRDLALDVCGLLSKKMYGPSVKPFQPEGTWQTVYSQDKWITSAGEDRYRRSVYTYWKRTSPYPSFLTFDVPSREVCSIRRISTNTPLQALVMLNDTIYLEAAIFLAEKETKRQGNDPSAAISSLYKTAIGRSPSQKSLHLLQELYRESVLFYRQDRTRITGMVRTAKPSPEAAALSAVANVVLNLDEFITKN